MNKTKMILAATGGVIGLAVLVMGYFTWDAYSARTAAIEGDDEEGTDGLDTVVSKAQTLSRKPVYPCAASLTAIESNRAAVAAWYEDANKLASRGDRPIESTTPAAFKTFIVQDAKRLAALPGTVNGALVKPDFAFGPFKDYIAEGKMPSEAQLVELQREWDDVALLVETLAKCGIAELTDVQFKDRVVKEEPKDKNQKAKQNNRKPAKGKKAEVEVREPKAYTYAITFTAKPAAFVKAVNAFATCERFVTVESFTFNRGRDVIADALGGAEKKAESQSTGRRGRRRGAAVVEEEKKDDTAAKNGIVTDPQLDAPLTVVMTATVYDFRSLEDNGEADAAASDKKGASK